MGDRMRPVPFGKLMEWVMEEYKKEDSIFGVPAVKFFKANAGTGADVNAGAGACRNLSLSGHSLENPIGPAAGPHTQLAQNIVAAYVAGGRFFELKTVQVIDGEDLPVSKPCILAEDEGYNVEWSTELTVPEAFGEYVKAWFALNILSRELALGSNKGFMFNMSVGYDLEGIKSPKIDAFIEGMKNASRTDCWKECRSWLLDHTDRFEFIDESFIEGISPEVCDSVTLSTLHGCPPQEIERIAKYLMGEKGLNTYVKCNPTLLGYDFVRHTLDQMGYGYIKFDERHFKSDLQFHDAVPMLERLLSFADEHGLTFGVKLSNTLPVEIENNELPGNEMYMSGRALYPLTINLAYQLSKAFGGNMRISYSGGADAFNIVGIFEAGIWPVTLASNLLKPGGYLRLGQLAQLLQGADRNSVRPDGAGESGGSGRNAGFTGIRLDRLKKLAQSVIGDHNHLKERRGFETRKLKKKVPLTDCFIAPCTEGCPIGQDIPEYIRLAGEKRYPEALEVILSKNPLPFITGTLCNHRCMSKCTRLDCDEAVRIREVKLLAARNGFEKLLENMQTPAVTSDYKAAVVGGGPAGLSAAYFLARNGVDVTVFEKRKEPGGVIRYVAPDFRISRQDVDNDLAIIRKAGVKFSLGADPDFSVKSLREQGYQYIFIAVGAWKPGNLRLDPCDRNPLNVLEFLEKYNESADKTAVQTEPVLKPGKSVAVVGAGNSAMDAARAAKRLRGVENVSIVYRRTKKYMPADREELELALREGVEFRELLSPVSYTNGILKCQKMTLGAPDDSGRRSPVAMEGEFVDVEADMVISAVGERVDTEPFIKNGIRLDSKGRVAVDADTNETSIPGVYLGGDSLRGPASIVEAIADGRKFADLVLEKENVRPVKQDPAKRRTAVPTDPDEDPLESEIRNKDLESCPLDRSLPILQKKGVIKNTLGPEQENGRCLECDTLCNICAEVCPNRANLAVRVSSGNLRCKNQILHIDGMCNECGNCRTFCPYDSSPYREKFTLFWSSEDFLDSDNPGFYAEENASLYPDRVHKIPGPARFLVRLDGKVTEMSVDGDGRCSGQGPGHLPKEIEDLICTLYRDYPYVFV